MPLNPISSVQFQNTLPADNNLKKSDENLKVNPSQDTISFKTKVVDKWNGMSKKNKILTATGLAAGTVAILTAIGDLVFFKGRHIKSLFRMGKKVKPETNNISGNPHIDAPEIPTIKLTEELISGSGDKKALLNYLKSQEYFKPAKVPACADEIFTECEKNKSMIMTRFDENNYFIGIFSTDHNFKPYTAIVCNNGQLTHNLTYKDGIISEIMEFNGKNRKTTVFDTSSGKPNLIKLQGKDNKFLELKLNSEGDIVSVTNESETFGATGTVIFD